MSTLRSMLDGVGSLQLNVNPQQKKFKFVKNQEVVIRRQTSRTGPPTFDIQAATIVSLDTVNAVVSVKVPGGKTMNKKVSLNSLRPVTESFRRKSIQFNPQHRQSL